jgi:hypothetical protein
LSYKLPEEKRLEIQQRVMDKITDNGHEYVSGDYQDRKSKLVVKCPKHGTTEHTTFYNYGRSRTGMSCCGKEQVSNKLTGREFSAETIQKMRNSALKRPLRGGKPRNWRKNPMYNIWKRQVASIYNYKCAVTGLRNVPPGSLVSHHLYCAKNHPELVNNPLNGILLHKDIHENFHKKYRYGNNTIHQFMKYLLSLIQQSKSKPISSQANPGGLEGSETRVYDPERVKKLHERLGGISKELDKILKKKKSEF